MLFNAISDETLYNQMAQGDIGAHDTLMMRYDVIGRQMALSMLRIYGIKNHKVADYYDVIYDSINKAFRYYSDDDSLFYPFIYEILRQNLYRTSQDFLIENQHTGPVVSLDAKVNDTESSYYDIVAKEEEKGSKDEPDVNELIDKFALSSNNKKRFIAHVFTMFKQGYTIKEIAAKTGRSIYSIRKIFENGKDYFNGDYMI